MAESECREAEGRTIVLQTGNSGWKLTNESFKILLGGRGSAQSFPTPSTPKLARLECCSQQCAGEGDESNRGSRAISGGLAGHWPVGHILPTLG